MGQIKPHQCCVARPGQARPGQLRPALKGVVVGPADRAGPGGVFTANPQSTDLLTLLSRWDLLHSHANRVDMAAGTIRRERERERMKDKQRESWITYNNEG